jgi:hypothetical protein
MHGLAARDRGINQRLFSMAQFLDFARCSADAVQLPELAPASHPLELPPEMRVDVLTVQRIRPRFQSHMKQEGGEGMVKSTTDFAERNSEQITNATRTGVDWVQEFTEQNIRQAQAMVITTRKVA